MPYNVSELDPSMLLGGGIALLVVMGAVFFFRSSRKGGPTPLTASPQELAGVSPMAVAVLGDALSLRVRALREGLDAGTLETVDRLLDQLFDSVPSLSERDPADRQLLEGLTDLLRSDPQTFASRAHSVHELLSLQAPGHKRVESEATANLRGALDRIRAGGDLGSSRVGSGLDAISQGDLVALDGELHEVIERSLYREKYQGHTYETVDYQLLSFKTGQKLSLSFEDDDEPRVDVEIERLRFADVPVSRAKLDEFDDEEEGSFNFRNQRFDYVDSGDSSFHTGGDGPPQKLYYWDFDSSDGSHRLSFELYDGTPEVYLVRRIPARSVEVLPFARGKSR